LDCSTGFFALARFSKILSKTPAQSCPAGYVGTPSHVLTLNQGNIF